MILFENKAFSDTELTLIHAALTDPLVKRYILSLAQQQAEDLATEPIAAVSMQPIDYAIKASAIQGSINALLQLVNIAK